MSDLIPFMTRQIGSEAVNTVNARDLYAYLTMTGDYSRWIKHAIKRANLVENIDFEVYYLQGENPKGGRPATEHHLSFDAAKHVAMMSNATKGHEVRLWFIQKEKELAALKADPASLLSLYPELRAIAELAVSTAQARSAADAARKEATEAKTQAQAAETRAIHAEDNANRAMESGQWHTVAEYVYSNGLSQQLPESAYRACSDHLRLYCMDRNIPFRKQAVGGKRWPDEYAFHENVYVEVLPEWLKRRYAQPSLHVIHTNEKDLTHG